MGIGSLGRRRRRTLVRMRLPSAAAATLLLVAGCGGDGAGDPPGFPSVPCDASESDFYVFEVPSDGALRVAVDTARPETAFDTGVTVWVLSERPASAQALVDRWGLLLRGFLTNGTCGFECTHPHADEVVCTQGDCAEVEPAVSAGAVVLVEVSSRCGCRAAVGEYVMEASLNGAPVELDYLGRAPGGVTGDTRTCEAP